MLTYFFRFMIESHFAILEWVASQVENSAKRPTDPWRQIEIVGFCFPKWKESEGANANLEDHPT